MALHKSKIGKQAPLKDLSSSKPQRNRSFSKVSQHNLTNNTLNMQKNKNIENSYTKYVNDIKSITQKNLFHTSGSMFQMAKPTKKRLSVSFSKKQLICQDSIIEESRSKKYIINEPKHSESSKTLTTASSKSKSSVCSLQNKTLLNQTTIINFSNTKVGLQKSKLKKKGPKYLKSSGLTRGIQKTMSSIPCQKSMNSTDVDNSSMELYRQKNGNQQAFSLLEMSSFNSKELQLLKLTHKKSLTRIQGELASLVNHVGLSRRESLIGLSNGYSKIICELYQALRERDEKGNCPTFSKSSKAQAFSQHVDTTDNTSHQTQNNCSTLTDLSIHQIEEFILSTHAPCQNQLHQSSANSCSAKSLVKKLNLTNLKEAFQVRQYHEEFLDMKENFSESWKRQLQKERKF